MNQDAHYNVKKQKYDYATFSYKKCLEICIFNVIYEKNRYFSVIENWEVYSLLCTVSHLKHLGPLFLTLKNFQLFHVFNRPFTHVL